MTIPGYQDFMYPFLEQLKDGEEHTLQEMYKVLAEYFNLSEEKQKQLLPSGKQSILHNRIGWARTYLGKAGLLKTVSRAVFVITEEGEKVLDNPLIKRIDKEFLMQYESYRQFINKGISADAQIARSSNNEKTPMEQLEESYRILKEETMDDLLERIMSCPPAFFEKLVVELVVAMGYGGSIVDAGQAIGRAGDEGIDGVIKEDILGLDMIYIQAKRWQNTVTRPEIQKFVGSLEGQRAKKGIFITTSKYSEGALEFVKIIDKKIILIDGYLLADLMFKYGVGVTTTDNFTIKRVDLDYFE